MRIVPLLLLALVAGQALAATVALVLPQAAMTSAGIFDADGRLVRTVWSGRALPRGTVAVDWDGRDEGGAPVPEHGHYTARVLSHDVRYVWEGVIGNTSSAKPGAEVHRAFGPVTGMAIDRQGNAFYVVGYNEQQPAVHRFRVTDPQTPTSVAHDDYRRVFRHVATDGELVYAANAGLPAPRGSFLREPATFVVALRVADGSEYRFAGGQTVSAESPGNRWLSVIDYDRSDVDVAGEFRAAPTGLAVQQRGPHLFVAHAALNELRILDKRSGRLLYTLPVEAPSGLAVAADESLWVICRSEGQPAVVRFRQVDSMWQQVGTLKGKVERPLALAVSPLDGTLAVSEGATEQVLGFDDQGTVRWQLGQPGGQQRGGPAVVTDRFWLSQGPTYLAYEPNGSLWIGDPGNSRNLRFSAAREFIDQILYLSHTYVATVDASDPARVFNQFLEFKVDYAVPLRRSWKLVRNWAAGLGPRYLGGFDGLRVVTTLSNGRSYGAVNRSDSGGDEVVELTATGLRGTGLRLRAVERLQPDGALQYQVLRAGSLDLYTRRLSGFDAQGNLLWAAPERLATVKGLQDSDPYYHDVPTVHGVNDPVFAETQNGTMVTFSPGRSKGFHLGGLRPATQGWAWRASPSGSWETGPEGQLLTRDGRYDLGHGVNYAGNTLMTSADSILYGYHGEAWNGGQANQWMHFHESGLFIGQFGEPAYAHQSKIAARPATAGNAFSPSLTQVGQQLYLWHNDESIHGGLHRWEISGMGSIRWLEAPVAP